jgi:hypothetical protein
MEDWSIAKSTQDNLDTGEKKNLDLSVKAERMQMCAFWTRKLY